MVAICRIQYVHTTYVLEQCSCYTYTQKVLSEENGHHVNVVYCSDLCLLLNSS